MIEHTEMEMETEMGAVEGMEIDIFLFLLDLKGGPKLFSSAVDMHSLRGVAVLFGQSERWR